MRRAPWVGGLLLLLSGALSYTATAQVGTWVAKTFTKFTGGLNDGADPTILNEQEASSLQNVVFTTSGAIAKRPGWGHVNPAATCGGLAATALTFYKQADGDRYLAAVCGNDTLKKMDYAGGSAGPDGVWDDITGALSFNTDADTPADFATAQDILVIEDGLGTTAPYEWSGSGNADGLDGSPPDATMVEFHKRHLWLAGRTDAPSRLDFSALDNVESWSTSTDFILVETDDGQPITGLKSGLDCLYAFKSHSIWRVCGTNKDDFTLEQMVTGVGAANNASITSINNQFIFLTTEGDVAIYNGGLDVQILSAKIEGTMADLDFDRLDEAAGVAFDDGTGDEDYYLCVSTAGSATHDRLLVFDTLHQAWTKFTGIPCNALTNYEIGTAQTALLFSDYTGFTNRYPTGNADNGQAIAASYTSGHLDFGIPQQKHFRHAQIILQQQSTDSNLTFDPRVDFETSGVQTTLPMAGSGALWDSAIYDQDTYADLTSTIANVELQRVGNYFQWHIEQTAASQPFLVRAVRIWTEETGRVE